MKVSDRTEFEEKKTKVYPLAGLEHLRMHSFYSCVDSRGDTNMAGDLKMEDRRHKLYGNVVYSFHR